MICVCENDKFHIPPEYLKMSVEELRETKQKLYNEILEETYKNDNKHIAEMNKDGTGGRRQITSWFE